ncbi:MAG: hypothetical protein IOD12_12110 [Silvanigrellales bacterium]|nr:hypothetical protein [Silvanigrellales bacterium]
MSVNILRGRSSGVRGFSVVSTLTLFGLAAGCGQDPAFTEQSMVVKPERAAKQASSDAKAGATAETDAGDLGARRGEGDPTTGEPLSSAPGVVADSDDKDTATSGSASGGGGAGGVVMDDSGGVRGGLGENPAEIPGSASGGSSGGAAGGGATGVSEPKPGAAVVFDTTQRQGKVDVLWIVDDSGSMNWAQSQLTSRFEAFARKLSDARVDFRVGVTSTDVCDIDWNTGDPKANKYCPNADDISGGAKVKGVMVGPAQGRLVEDPTSKQSVLTPSASFVSNFSKLAKIGTTGSGMEHGLTAARMAVEKSLSGVNKNFLRTDAFLSIIVLSDEEDDGVQMWCEDAWGRTTLNAAGQKDLTKCKKGGGSPFLDAFGGIPYALEKKAGTNLPWTDYKYTADNFKAYLDNPAVKGPGKFRVSAITGLRGADGKIDCSNPDVPSTSGPKESGTNYIKAAQATGGVVENICAPEWNQILGNVGANVGELANQIALPAGKVPYPGTLEVFIDGVKWDASKYEHKTQGNFLSFKVIPASGASIQVKYLETVN